MKTSRPETQINCGMWVIQIHAAAVPGRQTPLKAAVQIDLPLPDGLSGAALRALYRDDAETLGMALMKALPMGTREQLLAYLEAHAEDKI